MANNRSTPKQYGEVKKPWQFLLTPAASLMVNALAIRYDATRSDFVEQLIRGFIACDEETRDRLIAPVSGKGEAK